MIGRRTTILACGLLLATAGVATATYPPSTHLTWEPTPRVKRPAYLEPVTDPTFGTTVTRISDRRAFQRRGADALRHGYSKRQPWNADQSLLLLDWTYPAALLDGRTYELLRWVRLPSGALWTNTDPDAMIGVDGNRLVRFDVPGGRRTTLRRLPRYRRLLLGAGEGNLSDDDRYVALFAVPRGAGGVGSRHRTDVLVLDLETDRIVSRRVFRRSRINWSESSTFDNVTVSQSGRRVILAFDEWGDGRREGIYSYGRSLRRRVLLSRHGGSHFDACVDASGRDVIVITAPRGLVSIDLRTGRRRLLLPSREVSWSIHISCRNIGRPGWAYVSEYFDREAHRRANHDEIFALRLDGSRVVQSFAHEHYSRREAYVREPHAVPSPDGERVLWASDWGRRRGPVYSYVAEQR